MDVEKLGKLMQAEKARSKEQRQKIGRLEKLLSEERGRRMRYEELLNTGEALAYAMQDQLKARDLDILALRAGYPIVLQGDAVVAETGEAVTIKIGRELYDKLVAQFCPPTPPEG